MLWTPIVVLKFAGQGSKLETKMQGAKVKQISYKFTASGFKWCTFTRAVRSDILVTVKYDI